MRPSFAFVVAGCLLASTPALSRQFYTAIPFPGRQAKPVITVSLAPHALPAARQGKSYQFDLNTLLTVTGDAGFNPANVSWSITQGTLPAGMAIVSGVLTGSPAAGGNSIFTVNAVYKTASGEQSYSLQVKLPVTVTLATSALPDARVAQSYSFDLTPYLSVQNADSYSADNVVWGLASGTLPEGLTLEHGVLSGTPTIKNTDGVELRVTADYQGTVGEQAYTLIIDGIELLASKLATGTSHSCALTPEGAVYCWGSNGYGQLGDGTTTTRTHPVAVTGLSSGVKDISVGVTSTCALTSAGNLFCWGRNIYGQLGNGSTADKSVPTPVSGLGVVSSVAVGGRHACAILNGGAAYCWGEGTNGELGNGTTPATQTTPVAVTGLSAGVTVLAAGDLSVCAVASGTLKCWGNNLYGALGDNTTTMRTVPTRVVNPPSGVTGLTSGGAATCALTSGGAAYCWGYGGEGILGQGNVTTSKVPVVVQGMASGVKALQMGGNNACAIKTDNSMWCWGSNTQGQLGIGTTSTRSTSPVQVQGLGGTPTALSVNYHTCARLTSGKVQCWGRGTSGQLGNDATSNSALPVDVLPPTAN